MCYEVMLVESAELVGLTQRYKDIKIHYVDPKLTNLIQLTKFYHVSGFEHPRLPIITKDSEDYKIEFMEWGMIPHFEKEYIQNPDANRLNARGETIDQLKSFRQPFAQRKFGILPINAFYESQHIDGGFTIPHLIYDRWDEHLNMAVIYDEWTDNVLSTVKKSFSIITTEAAGIMCEIHSKNRMPVFLPESYIRHWLNPDISDNDAKWLSNFQYKGLEAHTVSKLANNSRGFRNTKEVAMYYEYTEANFNFERISRQARKREKRK